MLLKTSCIKVLTPGQVFYKRLLKDFLYIYFKHFCFSSCQHAKFKVIFNQSMWIPGSAHSFKFGMRVMAECH